MKKGKIVLIVILVLVLMGFGYKVFEIMSVNTKTNLAITRNQKVYKISDLDKRRLIVYIKKLKPLSDKEMVMLALIKDIEIQYGNDIEVGIAEGNTSYCYFYDKKKKNIHKLSHMPKGLYNIVMRIVKKN